MILFVDKAFNLFMSLVISMVARYTMRTHWCAFDIENGIPCVTITLSGARYRTPFGIGALVIRCFCASSEIL